MGPFPRPAESVGLPRRDRRVKVGGRMPCPPTLYRGRNIRDGPIKKSAFKHGDASARGGFRSRRIRGGRNAEGFLSLLVRGHDSAEALEQIARSRRDVRTKRFI